ncbi:MBL fold metallo-hydrolase [Paenibacillus mendelii]|uniref:MBL fold metallo-hydrolase n=1 Tax=Paenibacillus mendelii TaxID=206163 RepID=A0ABV6JDH0_9BACL|nr:MBL fold metallo-hydrolase [Paenibacillus mendelii]MCQ6560694.1 MBL fold metallo-hydrolase [Paenibacillus mendelii]
MSYQIDIIQLGRTQVPTIEINWMDVSRLAEWEPIIFAMVLIRGNGKTILINSGPPADYEALSDFWVEHVHPNHALQVSEDERPVTALAKYGVKPEDVDYVLVTPLTTYATGNLDLFPNAKIVVSRRGWVDFLAPEPYAQRLPKHIYMADPIFQYVMNEAFDRIVLLEDEEQEVLPGIRSFFTGSHHRSSMAYVIDTEIGSVIVSDCFFKYRNIEQNIPLGIHESLEETFRSYERIRNINGTILPIYDPEVFERHPAGKVV